MEYKFGFNYQEYGNCGQYALLNSLLLLGIPISVKDAHKVTNTTRLKALWEGTDCKKIIKGIKKYGCKPAAYTLHDDAKLKTKIDTHLEAGNSIILCIENYEHYCVLAGKKNKKYCWIDSADANIIGCSDWTAIEQWMNCEGEYYFIAVIPPKFSKPISEINELFKLSRNDIELFNNYGYLLRDLLDIISEPRTAGKRIAMETLLKQSGENIIESIEFLYHYTKRSSLEKLLKSFITISRLHMLTVLVDGENDVLARLTAMLTMYAMGIT